MLHFVRSSRLVKIHPVGKSRCLRKRFSKNARIVVCTSLPHQQDSKRGKLSCSLLSPWQQTDRAFQLHLLASLPRLEYRRARKRPDLPLDLIVEHAASIAAMCQYRYYYYGGCQHQETLLYSFCRHATAIDGQLPLPPSEAGANEGCSATTTELAPSTPQHSPAATPLLSPHSSSSAPTSLTSLTSLSEPSQDITSIFQHPLYFQHPGKLSPDRHLKHDMSALAAFSGMNLREMLSGKPKQTSSPEKPAASHEVLDSVCLCPSSRGTIADHTTGAAAPHPRWSSTARKQTARRRKLGAFDWVRPLRRKDVRRRRLLINAAPEQ